MVERRWAMTKVVRPRSSSLEALLDERLALGVEARRRLVEEEDARLGQDRAGDRHPLALPAGELDAALADHRLEPFVEAVGELGDEGERGRLAHLLLGRARAREEEVLADRAVEQEVVLEHQPELAPVDARHHLGQVDAVDRHPPLVGLEERGGERRERRLAGAGAADQGHHRAGGASKSMSWSTVLPGS
jgi:hypothetical protein